MSPKRENRVLAVIAIVTLSALLFLVPVIAGAPACPTPSVGGCPPYSLWAFRVPSLLVLSGLSFAVVKIHWHHYDAASHGLE